MQSLLQEEVDQSESWSSSLTASIAVHDKEAKQEGTKLLREPSVTIQQLRWRTGRPGGEAEHEAVSVGQIVGVHDGHVGLGRGMHLGQDLIGQRLLHLSAWQGRVSGPEPSDHSLLDLEAERRLS